MIEYFQFLYTYAFKILNISKVISYIIKLKPMIWGWGGGEIIFWVIYVQGIYLEINVIDQFTFILK